MKPVLVTVVVFCTMLLLVGGVQAKKLTLDDCIELALKNRASIIAARGSEDLAKADQRAALGAFLPRVNASYGYSKTYSRDIKSDLLARTGFFYVDTFSFVDGRTQQPVDFPYVNDSVTSTRIVEKSQDDQDRSNKALRLEANMSVFNLSNWFGYAAASANRAKAKLDVISSEQDLIYIVKVYYYAYLAAIENVAVQQEAVKRSEEQLKLIESKFDLGAASLSDVLKQKVQLGEDKLSLLSTRNATSTAEAELAYTIGIDPTSDVEFSTEYRVREYDLTLDEAVGFGVKHQPGLLAAGKDMDAAKHMLRARKADYLPKLSASANLVYSDGSRGDTMIFNFSDRSTTYGLYCSYNLFDGFLRERNLAQAKIARNNAMAALADKRNLVAFEIKKAHLDIGKTREQKTVARETVRAAAEDLKITQEKYNLGAATILDLLDAQVSLKRAQVSVIRSDFDLNLAVAALEKAMGRM